MASGGATPPWFHSSGYSGHPAWLCEKCCGRMLVLGHEWQTCHLTNWEQLHNPSPCPGGVWAVPVLLNYKAGPRIIRKETETHIQCGHAVKNLLLRSSPQSFLSQHVRYHFSASFAALCWMSMSQLVFELHGVMFISIAPNRKWQMISWREGGLLHFMVSCLMKGVCVPAAQVSLVAHTRKTQNWIFHCRSDQNQLIITS